MNKNNLLSSEVLELGSSHAHLLDPEALSLVSQEAADDLIREGESSNTLASYRAALRYWAAWYQLRFGRPLQLPLVATAVVQFVVDHAARTTPTGLRHELPAEIDQVLVAQKFKGRLGPMKLSTLLHRVAVISKVHQLRGIDNPCQDGKVKELVARTRRAYSKRGDLAEKKDALTKEPLLAMLETCDDSLIGVRDRALLLFAWPTAVGSGLSVHEIPHTEFGQRLCLHAGSLQNKPVGYGSSREQQAHPRSCKTGVAGLAC